MNKSPRKITPEESHRVFKILGKSRQSLCTAVVQLFIATNSSARAWKLVVTGVACFVKDSVRRGYYIQVREHLKGLNIVYFKHVPAYYCFYIFKPFNIGV